MAYLITTSTTWVELFKVCKGRQLKDSQGGLWTPHSTSATGTQCRLDQTKSSQAFQSSGRQLPRPESGLVEMVANHPDRRDAANDVDARGPARAAFRVASAGTDSQCHQRRAPQLIPLLSVAMRSGGCRIHHPEPASPGSPYLRRARWRCLLLRRRSLSAFTAALDTSPLTSSSSFFRSQRRAALRFCASERVSWHFSGPEP